MKIGPSPSHDDGLHAASVNTYIGDSPCRSKKAFSLKFSNEATEKAYQSQVLSGSDLFQAFLEIQIQKKHFFYNYYLICILYLIVYIYNALSSACTSKIIIFELSLFGGLILINSITFFLIFYIKFKFHNLFLLQLTYFFTGLFLVLNDAPVLNEVFEGDISGSVSCIPGLIIMLIISKFTLHTSYLCFALWNLFTALIYFVSHILTEQSYLATFIEISIYLLQISFETRKFYTIEHSAREQFQIEQISKSNEPENHDNEPATSELEKVTSKIKESISLIQYVADSLSGELKLKLNGAIKLANTVIGIISSKSNIYSADIEAITYGIDPEDRRYIKETWTGLQYLPEKRIRHRMRTLKTSELRKEYHEDELIGVLSQIGKNWNFDMFFLKDCTHDKPLHIVGSYCIKKYRLDDTFSIPESVYTCFFEKLESLYKNNPFHNSSHAADMLASSIYFINKSILSDYYLEFDILATIIACLGHDVGHPAFSNRFLVTNKDELAILYNDTSVLEMMHCSTVFQIMKQTNANILSTLSSDTWIMVRKEIVEMILATDMQKHFDILGQFRVKLMNSSPKVLENYETRIDIMKIMVKSADIGHAAKSRELHERWSLLVIEEFFNQGDIEKLKNQPISMYCDRETTDVAKSQAGFLKNIVMPLYEAFNQFLQSSYIDSNCMDQLKINMRSWEYKSARHRNRVKTVIKNENVSVYDNLSKKWSLRRGSTSVVHIEATEEDSLNSSNTDHN
ncbi:unnamed protein product [Blepharisma stoltei]|uniref:Phosphodiesterase n=1 Tax=Blepharisma stoltei TaxID=1481888 RepID=A0AAU9IVC4_9CILI|nr:unnamed protein product [Blepharisma stoltei]